MTPVSGNPAQVQVVLSLLSVYAGRPLVEGPESRRLVLTEVGISSLALASVIVELEDRLTREFDFAAFACVNTVGGLLNAIGLAPTEANP